MGKQVKEDLRKFNNLCSGINELYHEAAVKCGLSDSMASILYTIHDQGDGCTQKDVCSLFGISRQTVNSAIKKMVESGWIFLEPGGGRRMRIFLTDQGKAVMQEKVMPIIEAENQMLESWTAAERTELLQLARKYLEDFREQVSRI